MKACFIVCDFKNEQIQVCFFEGQHCAKNVAAMKELTESLGVDPGRIRICYDSADGCELAEPKQAAKAKSSYARKGNRFPGVGFHKTSGKWRAQIKIDGLRKYVGQYDSEESAILAAKSAQAEEDLKKKQVTPS